MMTLANYKIFEELQQDEKRIIARALEKSSNKKFVLKYLKSKLPSSLELAYFRNEIDSLSSLKVVGVPGLVKVSENNGIYLIVLEDFEGTSFNDIIYEEPVSVSKFLKVSISICRVLKNIHSLGYIHNDLKPSNIFINNEINKAYVVDFGIATDVKKQIRSGYRPSITEGTLSYMSPEQTGKYIQSIDHRSDLYSFGISLYEFAVQKLPFLSLDPLELVYSHIAETPESPNHLRPAFSEAISEIILKLISKSVEDRYKTTSGLLHDLLYCQAQFQSKGIIEPFKLGKKDFPDYLRIPQKLYGRKTELKLLEQAYEKTRKGELSVSLISGEEGLGKTTLVNNFRNYVTGKRGVFIEGRFERTVNFPYKAILQALEDMFDQILKVSDKKLEQIKAKIQERIGANIGLVTAMVPSSKFVLGEYDPPPALPDKESENRLLLTFRYLIKSLVEELGNVVVFLDDIHWADYPSLKMINWLVKNATTKNILFIAAYRNLEDSGNYQLEDWTKEINGMDFSVYNIELKSLSEQEFEEIIKDVFSASGNQITDLSSIIFKKTGGNPFFLSEFLMMVREENLITFHENSNEVPWLWDLEAIDKLPATDNVISLVINRIKKFDKNCLEILQTAACIGKQFDLQTLSELHPEVTRNKIGLLLKKAISEEFIYPIDQNYNYINLVGVDFNANYRFIHDRVLEAFHTYGTKKSILQNHLELGRLGLEKYLSKDNDGELLTTANHLYLSSSKLTDPEEKKQVAAILLEAGKKVKDNSGYAIKLLICALNLLPDNNFLTDPELTFDLYLILAQAEYINGDFSAAEGHYSKIEKNVGELDLKITAISQKMILYLQLTRYDEAIKEGKRGLEMLGYSLQKENPENINSLLGVVLSELGDRDVFDLVKEKEIVEQNTLMVTNLLSIILPASYLSGKNILWILTVLDITYLILTKGLSKYGILGISSFGMIVGGILGDRKKGFQFGEVAIKIAEKLKDKSIDSELKFVSGTFLAPYVQDEKTVNNLLDESINSGLQNGNLPYIGYSFQVKLAMAVFFGNPIQEITEYIDKSRSLIRSLGQPDAIMVMSISEDLLAAEYKGVKMPSHLLDMSHEDLIQYFLDKNLYIPLGLYCHLRSCLELIHGSYESVLELCKIVDGIKVSFFSHLLLISQRLNYFVSIARLNIKKENGAVPVEVIDELESLLLITKEENKGDNKFFISTISLMEGMLQWVKNGKKAGIEALEKVIQLGLEKKNYRNLAFASEFLGEEYYKEGKSTLAKAYLVDAINAWENYGCMMKSKELKKSYSEIFYEKTTIGGMNSWSFPQFGLLDQIDYRSVLKSSHLLLAEKELDLLLQEFLKICIENAGAQRGLFFTRTKEFWNIMTICGEWRDEELDERNIPIGILNAVERKGEIICLSNASTDENYREENYFRISKAKSVLSAPVIYKNKLKGVIYFENSLMPGAFGDETKEMISLLSSQIGVSIENAELYTSLEKSNKELEAKVKDRTKELSKLYSENERLLLNMLPSEIADRLKTGETYIADNYNNVSVIFIDIVNFTGKSESLSPKKLVEELHECFKGFDQIIEKFKLEKIKTIGDAFLAVCGLPKKNPNHALQVIKAAIEIISFIESRKQQGGIFDVRIGVNSGSVVAGVVGVRKFAYDIWGDTVNVAARMEQNSETGRINVSGSTYQLIKDDFTCIYRGKIPAKNKGEIDMYFVE